MPTYFDAATIERARVLVETTARTLEDIAVELGTSVQTLRNWIKRYGWRRHPQAPRARPKLPPEKEGPARRIYESGAQVGDLAVLLDCHESYVHRLAKQRGWMRWEAALAPAEAEPAEPPSEAVMEITAGFLDPHLTRGKLIGLIEDLAAVTIARGADRRRRAPRAPGRPPGAPRRRRQGLSRRPAAPRRPNCRPRSRSARARR